MELKEKVKAAGEKLKGAFGKLSKKTRILLGSSLAAILVLALAVTIVLNNRPYAVLFTGLSGQEAANIMSYLEENGATDYRLENNDTILVPQGQEARLKAMLLMEGFPKSGFSYATYFSNVGSLATESERNTAYLIALQERMEAVLRCFEGVKDASVGIVQGEDRRYILDESKMVEASAWVLLTMAEGRQLDEAQAAAIRNLVSRAVQGLQIENISISDTTGNVYGGADPAGANADASALKLRLEEQVNNRVRTNIMQVLSALYGLENVKVSVNSVVDVSRTSGASTTYELPEYARDGSTGGRGIIGSQVYDNAAVSGAEGGDGGVAGAESNADIPTYPEIDPQPDGTETQRSASGQVDYRTDTQTKQWENPAGIIADVMVAVSINSAAAGGANAAALLPHVARAAGIDDESAAGKISILIQPFYEAVEGPVPPREPIPQWVLAAAAGGLVLFLLVLLVLAKLRKRRRRKRLAAEQALAGAYIPAREAPQPSAGADVMSIQTEKSMELRKDVRQFADDNPEIAAQMVKSWLRGGEGGG